MAAYNLALNGVTTSTSNDSMTIVTAASGKGSQINLYEVFIGGQNGSSALSSMALARSTGGTTGGGPITPAPLHPNSDTASLGFSVYTSWSAQPTLGTTFVLMPTFQGNGGQYKWWAVPGRPIVIGTGAAAANLSFRCIANTSVITADFKIEPV